MKEHSYVQDIEQNVTFLMKREISVIQECYNRSKIVMANTAIDVELSFFKVRSDILLLR